MYQNNASFFVRQFQNNMLRKQAGMLVPVPGSGRILREIVGRRPFQLATIPGGPGPKTWQEAAYRTWVGPGRELMVVPGQSATTAAEATFRRIPWHKTSRVKNVMKYAVPAAAGAAAAAAAGSAGYGVAKLTEEDPKERIKQLLYAYAPYVGGGAAIGALLGGGIGYANDNTLLGTLGGTIAGAGLVGGGKYLYDRYKAQA